METIKKAITYVFNEKGWENKTVVLYVALLVVTIIGMFLNLIISIPLEVINTYVSEMGKSTPVLSSLSSSMSSTSSLFMLPVTLYIMGYLIDVVRNIAGNKKEVLPEHKDVLTTFVKGLKLYITTFIATLPTSIVGGILLILSFFGAMAMFVNYGERGTHLALGIVLVTLTFVLAISLGLINSIITYASWYIYYQSNSFRKAFNYKEIISVIKNHERSLLRLLGKNIVLGLIQIVACIAALILICISFFIFPLITLVGYFARAYIFGITFDQMSKLEKK